MTKLLFRAILLSLPLFLLVSSLTACSSAPVQEMSDARQAIIAAKQVGAEKHSPTIYSDARKYLLAAEIAIRSGHFPQAKRSAIQAKKQAVRARKATIGIGAIQ